MNTDPYYSHAMDTATARLKNAQGAQGIFGSSVGTQQIADSNANLLGQQALANANYGLQRGQVAGNLAAGADLSSRGASQDMLGWLGGMGGLGLGLQNADLSRLMAGGSMAGQMDNMGLAQLMAGVNAAQGAQGALRGRAQDYFNNQLAIGDRESQATGNIYGQMLGQDQGLFQNQQDAYLGYPREGLNQSLNGRKSSEEGIGNGLAAFGKMFGM